MKELVAIHLPCLFKAEDPKVVEEKLNQHLGGRQNLQKCLAEETPRLKFYFDPKRKLKGSSLSSKKYTSNRLLIRVRKRKSLQWKNQKLEGEICGVSQEVHLFDDSLPDIIFFHRWKEELDITTYEGSINLAKQIEECLLPRQTKLSVEEDIVRSREEIFVPAKTFIGGEVNYPISYLFEEQSRKHDEVSAKEYGESPIIERFKIVDWYPETRTPMPTKIDISTISWPKPIQKIVESVRSMFKKRPIWTNLALSLHLKVQPKKLSAIVSKLAVRAKIGAFGGTYIRIGYNPALDEASRKYQVVGFHLENPNWLSEFAEKHKGKFNLFGLPVKARNKWQLCDINDSLIRDFIKVRLQDGAAYNYESNCGWYSAEIIECIRNRIKDLIQIRKEAAENKRTTSEMKVSQTWEEEDWTDYPYEDFRKRLSRLKPMAMMKRSSSSQGNKGSNGNKRLRLQLAEAHELEKSERISFKAYQLLGNDEDSEESESSDNS